MKKVMILCVLAMSAVYADTGEPEMKVIEIRNDVHVRDKMEWRDAHYKIYGDVIFHEGGELLVENATIEAMCTYTREFSYLWKGGTLITRNVTIGGSYKEGIAYQTYFEIQHGAWICDDTTIQLSSGVCMGWQGKPVKFHANRLKQGPHPDSIIMSPSASDVMLKDSEFNISLAASAQNGGEGHLEMPTNEPVNYVYDASNVPGVKHRLELINTKVPLWWLFVSGVVSDGPPTEIVFGKCTSLILNIITTDLKGTFSLPSPWPSTPTDVNEVTVGNLTFKTAGERVQTWCWGLYFSGEKTDVTLQGDTTICELFVSEGRVVMEGDVGTYNAKNACTTIEVGDRNVMDTGQGIDQQGHSAELIMRNVSLGRFSDNDEIIGQITAHHGGKIMIDNARTARLKLITKSDGEITMKHLVKTGAFTIQEDGGPITIEP